MLRKYDWKRLMTAFSYENICLYFKWRLILNTNRHMTDLTVCTIQVNKSQSESKQRLHTRYQKRIHPRRHELNNRQLLQQRIDHSLGNYYGFFHPNILDCVTDRFGWCSITKRSRLRSVRLRSLRGLRQGHPIRLWKPNSTIMSLRQELFGKTYHHGKTEKTLRNSCHAFGR